jgi:PAS domain S-box-containing protein
MKAKPVILVVDDQPQNIELLEAYLVPQGYEIVKAANGEEAMEKLSGHPIDLLLLDVMMPGMDGFEVTRRVRQDNTHRLIPIILVTVLREREDRIKGIEAGCDDFISYPVDKMELLARVRSLLKVKAYNELMSNYRKELESEVTRRTEELNHALENLQQDVIQRKLAEEALKKSENKYRLLADNAQDVIFVMDMNLNYTYVSPSVKILRGYEPEEALKQTSFEILTPSSMDLAVRNLSEIMELEKSGQGDIPISRTLQLEMVRKDRTTVWTEVTFSLIRDENQRIVSILGVTRDITERKQEIERIRKALGATVQAIAMTVETRDPYTAGHQRRVADLACAIAVEMNLPIDMIDGIRMAAAIHDLGKISVPAEMLSKPTKLTDLEFMMIKTHSQSGYDILKDIEFPWPVARTILEHHERTNGSGYPHGLTGDHVLMESRILSVADVVEAMASHRPYRASLGIDEALNEISKNKGILYDPEVVDACLRLFHEKKYQIID